jgi:hypothetical protein
MPTNHAFAHRQLRDFAFSKPFHLQGMLSTSQGRQTLAEYWNHLAQERGEAGGVKGTDFQSEIRNWHDGSQVGILRLPHADEPGDALMIAVVVTLGPRRWLILRGPPRVRYFTLERMMGAADEPARRALCEWTRSENGVSHVLYDATAEATADSFCAAAETIARAQNVGG